jgi:hypothetical protein
MAKLRLQRQLTAERFAVGGGGGTATGNENVNFSQTGNTWFTSNGNAYGSAPLHAHSVPSSPIKRPLTMSSGNGRVLPGTTSGCRLLNTTVEQQMSRLRQRLPVCKSSPPSAVLCNSSSGRSQTPVGRQIAKYGGDSPATQMRRELRFFAQERKRELQEANDERATYLGPYPPAWHQQLSSSDSDLNALLDLWSHPPDPVRDRQPPAGASNLQRVPQYVLGTSGTSLHELRPSPTRRASYGCGAMYAPTGATSRHSTGASLYGASRMNASSNSLGNLGYGTSYDYEYGLGPAVARPPSRPLFRYGSCGRLDDYYGEPQSYGVQTIGSLDGSFGRDWNNNVATVNSMPSPCSYAQNSRHWSNNSKNCVTLLPTRPYRL